MTSLWDPHRTRAEELRDRHPHAAEMLTLYLALVDVWDAAWQAGWSTDNVLPEVVRATVEHGPGPLADAAREIGPSGAGAVRGWLAGEELGPVERYVARATLRGVAAPPYRRDTGPCPECGGPPQLSYRTAVEDPLVSGRRMLLCARCAATWNFSASRCPSCGEAAKRTVYTESRANGAGGESHRVGRRPPEGALFPHVRVDGCEGCRRYLIDIDLGLDPRAVPEVDELAALPLDLHAAEQGLSKITPNLMGI